MNKFFIVVLFLLMTTSFHSHAQRNKTNKEIKLNLKLDLSNRHVWRGLLCVDQKCLKPTIEYVRKRFTAGAWSLFTTDNSVDEIDLYLVYKIKNWKFRFCDTYLLGISDKNKSFFDYGKNAGIHIFDFYTTYTLDGSLPLTILAAGSWAANEINYSYFPTKGNDDTTKNIGELRTISWYLELNYPTHLGSTKINYILGMAPGKSKYSNWVNEDGRKHYSDGAFYLTNIGLNLSDKIKITDKFSIPISAELTFNPHQEKIYLQFNIGLNN
ncbi:MAG: hypothetical protein WBG43_10300 [Marinifilaceae bacterium]